MKIAKPQVFLVGQTGINVPGLEAYLKETGNQEFLEVIAEARTQGLGDNELISSFFAKLCYRSLSLGKNANVKKIRSIKDNIIRTIEEGHGSIFEHAGPPSGWGGILSRIWSLLSSRYRHYRHVHPAGDRQ